MWFWFIINLAALNELPDKKTKKASLKLYKYLHLCLRALHSHRDKRTHFVMLSLFSTHWHHLIQKRNGDCSYFFALSVNYRSLFSNAFKFLQILKENVKYLENEKMRSFVMVSA